MQISFSHEMLAITLEDNSKIFYHLQNLIERNFSKWIGRKNKTIIFKQDDEDVKRRYFLKLVGKIYMKLNKRASNSDYNNILLAQDKSIKIVHLKSNQIQQQLKIDVKIEDNYVVVFYLSGSNSIFVNYLKNYFKNHLVQYRPKNYTVTIYPESSKTIELLEKLFQKKEIIGCYVEFNYNKKEYEQYRQNIDKKSIRKRKSNALFNLLEEYFKVLECSSGDSFETIRKQYLRLVKRYHPDRVLNSNQTLLSHYSKKFQDIKQAYEIIKIYFEQEKKITA